MFWARGGGQNEDCATALGVKQCSKMDAQRLIARK